MKKIIAFLFGIGFLLYVSFVSAADHSITVTWDYFNPPRDFAGFELRINRDDSNLISIPSDAREWTGVVSGRDARNVVDMRAKDASDLVSVWSEPAYFNPAPNTPTSVKVTVEVVVTINSDL